MKQLKRGRIIASFLAGAILAASESVLAQFVPGQILSAQQLNSALAAIANNALSKTGGTLTGPVIGTAASFASARFGTATISGGSIDGAPIGASSPSTGSFTGLSASGATTLSTTNLNGVVTGAMPPPPWATYSTAYNPMWVNVNGFPVSAMNGNNTHAISSAFTGSIDTPASDNALWDGNVSFNAGLSGYARSASPNKGSVGVFGVGMSNADNTQQWGGNFVATNFNAASGTAPGQIHFYSVGAEADIYLNGTGLLGTAVGFKIAGQVESVPAGGLYAMEFAPANVAATLGYSAVLAIDDGPNTTAMSVGSMGLGNNLASQTIQFKSRNSAGTSLFSSIFADANGNLTLSPAGSVAIPGGMALGSNGVKAGTVSLANGAAGGASVVLQSGATGLSWNFNLPPNAGTAGQVLTTQGGGNNSMTWSNVSGPTYNTSGAVVAGARTVIGSATLASGSASVAFSGGSAFTSASSYVCTVTDTTAANAVRVSQTSGSAMTLTGTGSDVVQFICAGS